MVDAVRAYRRWLWRRLALLGPAAGAAIAVVLLLGVQSMPTWLAIACLAAGALLGAPLLWILAQTIVAARLHGADRRREARLLRRDLRSYPLVACGCLLLLAVLVRAPDLFREDAPPPPVAVAARVPGSAFELTDTESPEPTVTRLPAPAPDSAPPRPAPPPVAAEPPPPARPAAAQDIVLGDVQDEERPRTDPWQELSKLDLRSDRLEFERYRVPDENDAFGQPEAGLQVDTLYLVADEEARGFAGAAVLDLPFNRRTSFRASVLVAALQDTEEVSESFKFDFESDTLIRWEHVTLEIAHRLLGHTRRAEFDLSVSIGLSIDTFDFPDREHPSNGRVAPYFAIDASLWQTGTFALVAHLGQSIPVNITGGTAMVTDVSVALRVDLSERISLRFGYRALFVNLRDYADAFDGEAVADRHERVSGPFIGFDVAF